MDTRNTPSQNDAAVAGREAVSATLAAEQESKPQPFAWQALLLRYLPAPLGPDHSIKRFGLR